MGKSLPYYYIITLWIAAIVSVFLILVPLLSTKNNSGNLIELSAVSLKSGSDVNNNIDLSSQNISTDESGDLIFYNKTSFIRYFNNQYKEEDLSLVYEKAIANKTNHYKMNSVKVIRKKQHPLVKQNFSGSFDIKPVPEN